MTRRSEPVVFVLAMGRSGTSAITRVLSLAGVAALPENLMAPNSGNPTGYWESDDVVDLNDAFFERARSNYYDPTLFVQSDDRAFESEAGRAFVDSIAAFFSKCDERRPLLIKDPRIPAVAPYWFRAAAKVGRDVRCVLPVREPRASIASVIARDAISAATANVLWLKNTLLAERGSRRFPRLFIDYAEILEDWRAQVDRVECGLGLERAKRIKSAIRSFIDPRLDHGSRPAVEALSLLPYTQLVYEQIAGAARGLAPNERMLDDAFEALIASDAVVASHDERPSDPECYRPYSTLREWDALGLRLARELSKGPPFPSA